MTEVNLTQAAAWLLLLHDEPDLTREYRGALGMFAEMLSLDNAEALAYARELVARKPTQTVAIVPPL